MPFMIRQGRLPLFVALLVVLLTGLVPAGRPARAQATVAPPAWVPGRVLVKPCAPAFTLPNGRLQAGALWSDLGAVFARVGLTGGREVGPGSGLYALEGGAGLDVAAAVAALQAQGGIAYAEPDYVQQTTLVPNDERYADQEWWLTAIGAQTAWDTTTGDPNLIIAILDTGVAVDHPEFAGRIVPGYNFVSNNNDPYDDNGHGTHVAGIAGATGNNGQGIAGITWQTRIMPIKALNADGQGATSDFAAGIRWAVDNGARVINISAGADFSTETEHEAIRYATSRNVVVVAAAGNSHDGQPQYPAGYDEVIAVSATSRRDSVAGFSSYGDYVDVAAPGINILSTWVTGRTTGYMSESGTSMASPVVAGAAALILSVNPGLNPEQVKLILQQTADDIGDPGFDPKAGWGRINLPRALQQAPNGPAPQAPPTATPAPAAPNQSHIQGQVQGIAPDQVDVLLVPQNGTPPRTIGPDAAGVFAFNNLFAGKYTVQVALKVGGYDLPAPQTVELSGSRDSSAQVNFSLTVLRPPAFAPVPDPAGGAGVVYFAPVQHTLRGPFLQYWQSHGGLAVFGYPLSEEFQEVSATDGRAYTVQYFERNRFEYHPEFAGTPNAVLLGLLGVERTAGRNFPPGVPGPTDGDHQWFAPVQHNLSGPFLRYWNANGGLAIFGYPISEPFEEANPTDGTLRLVQYFERNRFELHPEFAGTPAEVLLGLLGVDTVRARGWLP